MSFETIFLDLILIGSVQSKYRRSFNMQRYFFQSFILYLLMCVVTYIVIYFAQLNKERLTWTVFIIFSYRCCHSFLWNLHSSHLNAIIKSLHNCNFFWIDEISSYIIATRSYKPFHCHDVNQKRNLLLWKYESW